MPAQQQDYIVRHLQTISRLVARLRAKGRRVTAEDETEVNEALLMALHLQEKNFGMPATVFLTLSAEDQFAALRSGPAEATERCLTYATLLRETAELYAWRDRSDLALGARQLALYIALRTLLDDPAAPPAARALVEDLRRLLDGAVLIPPAQELVDQLDRAVT